MKLSCKCLILIATHNGRSWIQKQLLSILGQRNVHVSLLISDDCSTDGTYELICGLAENNFQIQVLPRISKFGGAGKNFYSLLINADFSTYDYIAFSDQDDIWEPDKLITHVEIAQKNHADGVSSNVLAFWPNGSKKLLNKAQPQKDYDFLFESAGPGCTFLMTPCLTNLVRDALLDDVSPAKAVALHDWLVYAICRVHGFKWVIDPKPSVLYRQHQNNVLGANVGLKAKLGRLSKLRQGWYRLEVMKIVEVCNHIKPNRQVLEIANLLKSNSFIARLMLLTYVPKARRTFAGSMLLGFCILVGLF